MAFKKQIYRHRKVEGGDDDKEEENTDDTDSGKGLHGLGKHG